MATIEKKARPYSMDSLETQQAVRIIEILTEFTETATHLDAYRYNNRSRFVPRHGLRY